MWKYKSKGVVPSLNFFRPTLAGMWTWPFKLAKDKIPKEGEDLSFEVGYEAPPISILTHVFIFFFRRTIRQIFMNNLIHYLQKR